MMHPDGRQLPETLIVKICGITCLEDAFQALEAGADWLGLVRWPGSKRWRPLEETAEMAQALRLAWPRPFQLVGVFVDAERETIETEVRRIGLHRIQLHGRETPELAHTLSRPVLKAFRVRSAQSLQAVERYAGMDLLADAYDPEMPGGTGRTWDYQLLKDLAASRRVIVAGGLDEANVARVVRDVRPWGVDVSSAVEREPGIKDADKMRRFVAAAHAGASGGRSPHQPSQPEVTDDHPQSR